MLLQDKCHPCVGSVFQTSVLWHCPQLQRCPLPPPKAGYGVLKELILVWNTRPFVTPTCSGVGWSPGLTHRLGRVILAWAQKVPEARRAGSEWALDGSTTGRFQTQAPSSSALPSFPLTFSSFLSPVPASCVFLPTSLQLLVCILLRDAEQMLIEDALLTVGSAWLWASCLATDKGSRVSLGTYKIFLLSWALLPGPGKDWQKVRPGILHLGDTRQPQNLPLLPSGVSILKDPTNLSTWLSGAGCSFGVMCIWFSAQDLVTDHLPWL